MSRTKPLDGNSKNVLNENENSLIEKKVDTLKSRVKNSLMSGSGSTFFVLSSKLETDLDLKDYDVFENLKTINTGVEEVNE